MQRGRQDHAASRRRDQQFKGIHSLKLGIFDVRKRTSVKMTKIGNLVCRTGRERKGQPVALLTKMTSGFVYCRRSSERIGKASRQSPDSPWPTQQNITHTGEIDEGFAALHGLQFWQRRADAARNFGLNLVEDLHGYNQNKTCPS